MARNTPPSEPTSAPLTESERVFVDEYLVDRNATRAYRAAFPGAKYTTARVNASQLLTSTDADSGWPPVAG